jgi:hypothetical protein
MMNIYFYFYFYFIEIYEEVNIYAISLYICIK